MSVEKFMFKWVITILFVSCLWLALRHSMPFLSIGFSNHKNSVSIIKTRYYCLHWQILEIASTKLFNKNFDFLCLDGRLNHLTVLLWWYCYVLYNETSFLCINLSVDDWLLRLFSVMFCWYYNEMSHFNA